jgi:sec-independent protein translocase protein TatB
MLDLSWGEIAFVAVLALIVVGPKDLPRLARGVGQAIGRVQRIYREQMFNLRRLENEIDAAQIVVTERPAAERHVQISTSVPVSEQVVDKPAPAVVEAVKPS